MMTALQAITTLPGRGVFFLRHSFIPHEGNNHQPLALRPSALRVYSVALIISKLVLTGFLYAIYPSPGSFAELTEAKILQLTNASRKAQGLPALVLDAKLNGSAHAKAQDMLQQAYFDHTNPNGKKFWQWIRQAGYTYTTAGENLAMDFTTAESAHGALMASPTHRANLLKSAYRDIGLAVVQGEFRGRKTIILVEHFGAAPALAKQRQKPSPAAPAAPQPVAVPEAKIAGTTTEVAPSVPALQAQLIGMSEEQYAAAPETTVPVWVEFRNAGTSAWTRSGQGGVMLVPNDDAAQSFQDSSWVSSDRVTALGQEAVAANTTARFSFTLRIPGITGDYQPQFALVQTATGEAIPGGVVTLPITAAAATPVAATQPDVAAPAVETVGESDQPLVVPVTDTSVPLVVGTETGSSDWQRLLIDMMERFYWAFLLFLGTALLLNIFIKIQLQHHHIILQSLFVLALTAFLALMKFHFAERIAHTLVT